jgi:hypothetical protein
MQNVRGTFVGPLPAVPPHLQAQAQSAEAVLAQQQEELSQKVPQSSPFYCNR